MGDLMKYFICKKDEDAIVIVKEITLEEYEKWKHCTEQLKYYSLAKKFRDIAIKNGLELERYLKKIKRITKLEEIRKINNDSIGIESNRLTLNYLVAFRTFVDNIQSYSHHIKNGKEFEKNILNWMYENEGVYAFFSKLRNFATHFSMVFDSITIESDKINLECSKKHLLEYDSWKKENIEFINSCEEEYLPILNYIEHNNVLIMSVYLGFINYYGEDIQDMHNNIMNLMKEYQILNPLFIESESESNLVGSHMFGLGLNILKEATEEFAQTPNVKVNFIGPEQILNSNE